MSKVRTIIADPPWRYNDKLLMSDTPRSADSQYKTLTIPEIEMFFHTQWVTGEDGVPDSQRLPYRLAEDAFLWLWITNPFLLDGTGARICKAWGFIPKQLMTWVKGEIIMPNSGGRNADYPELKPAMGLGHYTRGATEHMILATKGQPKVFVKEMNVPNVFVAPRGKHSEKPEASYRLIERVTPGPYVELFARKRREGWECYGDQLS